MDRPMLSVTIPSHLAFVNCARAFVVAVCKAYEVSDETTDSIGLALHEALTNVIRHGHAHQFEKLVQLSCQLYPDRIELHIIDEAGPFDLTQVPELDPTELRVGGRGVYLMRAIFDELACERRPEGGNRLRLVKRCPVKIPEPSSG